MTEQNERRINPLVVRLSGGVLDGDSFELLPQGSVLPPIRLSYAYRANFITPSGSYEEHACYLHYECKDKIPEWSDEAVVYSYTGKEKMVEDL